MGKPRPINPPVTEETGAVWQPIETAPKDGRLILGYDARLGDNSKHARHYAGTYQDAEGHHYRGSAFEVICWVPSIRSSWRMVDNDTMKRHRVDWSHWARSQGSWSPTHWAPLPEYPAIS